MSQIVICKACQKANRVDLEKAQTATPTCGHCKVNLPIHDSVQEVTDQTLALLIAKSDLPVVVDFWAPWCGPCRMFAPTFKETAKKMGDQFVFAKLNTEDHPMGGATHSVRAIPTLIIFKNGQELTRESGAMPGPRFEQFLKRSVANT